MAPKRGERGERGERGARGVRGDDLLLSTIAFVEAVLAGSRRGVTVLRLASTSTMVAPLQPYIQQPNNAPTKYKIDPRTALGIGHFCHARPQSSGITIQPTQLPTNSPTIDMKSIASAEPRNRRSLKTRSQLSLLRFMGPKITVAGMVVNVVIQIAHAAF